MTTWWSKPASRAAPAIVVLAPAGQGDERDVLAAGAGAYQPAGLVAVEDGHAEVEEDQLRAVGVDQVERLLPVVGDLHLVAHRREQRGQAVGAVGQVVDDEHALALGVAASGDGGSGGAAGLTSSWTGSRTVNSLPWPSPALRAQISPPCISTRLFVSDRPMPSPPWARSSAVLDCPNISKMCGICAGAMPMPVSWTMTTTAAPSRRTLTVMPTAGRRVLGGVDQQVGEDLGEARQVALEGDRLGRQVDCRRRGRRRR